MVAQGQELLKLKDGGQTTAWSGPICGCGGMASGRSWRRRTACWRRRSSMANNDDDDW